LPSPAHSLSRSCLAMGDSQHPRGYHPWGRHKSHGALVCKGADNVMGNWLIQEPKNTNWISGIDKERLSRLGLPRAARPVHSYGRPIAHGGFGSQYLPTCALLADSTALEPYRPRSHAGSVGSRTSVRSRRSQADPMPHSASVPGLTGDNAVGMSTALPPVLLPPPTADSQRGIDTASAAPSSQLCPACRCKRCGRSRGHSRTSSRCETPGARQISTAPAPLDSSGLGLGLTALTGTDAVAQGPGVTMERPTKPKSLLPELVTLLTADKWRPALSTS